MGATVELEQPAPRKMRATRDAVETYRTASKENEDRMMMNSKCRKSYGRKIG